MTVASTQTDTIDVALAARAHYIATGEGGDLLFFGVSVRLSALYLAMKEAESDYSLLDTDETYQAWRSAQKAYYRVGGK